MDSKSLARMIDHTLLKADATESDISQLCREAVKYGFYSVCVNPRWVSLASELLQGSQSLPIAVVGFPLGASTTKTKAFETENAVALGAKEIDMVIDLGSIKSELWTNVSLDIKAVVTAAAYCPVKVILETCYLSDDEIRRASKVAQEAGAKFIKTSTGFGSAGATVSHIQIMREVVGPVMGVKASGGIRDLKIAEAMIAAGANRLGCSASVSIVTGAAGGKDGY